MILAMILPASLLTGFFLGILVEEYWNTGMYRLRLLTKGAGYQKRQALNENYLMFRMMRIRIMFWRKTDNVYCLCLCLMFNSIDWLVRVTFVMHGLLYYISL